MKKPSRRLRYYETATCELSEGNENSDDSEDDEILCRKKIKERGNLFSPQKSVNNVNIMSVETKFSQNQEMKKLDSSTARMERQKVRESQFKQLVKEREEAEVAYQAKKVEME